MASFADHDVLVIGAGAAGVGAGRRLSAAGLDVLLVEARSRLGGRAYTDPNLSVALDHGCSWLWGGPGNPLAEAAREAGLSLSEDPGNPTIFFGPRRADASEAAAFETLRAEAFRRLAEAPERAIAEVVDVSGPFAAALDHALGPWMMGEETSRVAAAEWGAVAPGERHTDLLVEGGLGALIARLGDGLPVRLNTAVTSIDWSDRPVQVLTEAGLITAKAVILTVSNGVLASPGFRIRPHLPDEIHEALDGLPMGLLAKFLYVFDEDVFGLGDTQHLFDAAAPSTLWVTNLHGAPSAMGLYGGDLARELEAAGEEEAIDFGLEALSAIFGEKVKRACRGARATRWGADPFAFGAYTVARPGKHHLRAALDAPFDDRLFIAGECWRSDGTAALVSGAYQSGWDVAGQVLAALAEA